MTEKTCYVKENRQSEGAERPAKTPGQRSAMWAEGLFWLDFFVYFLHLRKKVNASTARVVVSELLLHLIKNLSSLDDILYLFLELIYQTMKLIPLLVIIQLVWLSCSSPTKPFPQAKITNGQIDALLYLPDPENGYYRGSRFDWSGVIPELSYQGHTYFDQWFKEYNPTLHDAIMGPVEAFSPIGYEEASPGDPFLIVGIGMVSRMDTLPLHFTKPYPLLNGGTWTTKQQENQVTFVQQLDHDGYGYEYTKTVQLTAGKPEMILFHRLKNTGTKVIETDVYNHNFFVIDEQPTGPDFTITFPFQLQGEAVGKVAEVGRLEGNILHYNRVIAENESFIYNPLLGHSDQISDYDIHIENHRTGAGVRIIGDHPLSKLVCWSTHKTLCPEPYIKLMIPPGETTEWTLSYVFYEKD